MTERSSPPMHHNLADLQAVRIEGLALLDRCLSENSTADYERFIQAQIVRDPPSIALLNELLDDIHQRCQLLRHQARELDDPRLDQQQILAQSLYDMVNDWVTALAVATAQRSSSDIPPGTFVQSAHNWSNRL